MKNVREYFKPTSIPEAVNLLREYPGKGAFIAGGTNIVVEKDPTLDYLVDVNHLGLNYITEDEHLIHIGAGTTIEQLYASRLVNTLASGLFVQVASWFASRQIRNVATIGGNVAEGLSAADTVPPLMAMDAQIVLVGEIERTLPIMEFFRKEGLTVLNQELVKEFIIPKEFQQARGKFLKNARTREDISIVSVTTVVLMDGGVCRKVRIALGAVAPTPIRIPQAEALLEGQIPTKELIEQAADTVVAQIAPIDNFRAMAQFRKDISHTYTKRALSECCHIVI
ncbi:molybdopterin dehydrogenase FAD-binding protein [Candidatus Vecturithrix granuli]|uniref:Molybdopterin dehydrogenase FAD-binding protein n=1 Tax=Vecturithrix granuli TaxID=1499967 RepID=A0A081C6J8_VECG1|nr:molybdopterin dehydrogenase FAD-binding protein [Candidatus Vecturithrix granuli]